MPAELERIQTYDIRLLVLDADGTTLDPAGRVSPATRRAVRAAQRQGVRVVLNTGRLHSSAARVAREAGLDEPVLSCNGAAASSLDRTPRVWWRDALDREDLDLLLKVLDDFGCSFELYVGDHIYTSRRSFSLRAFWGWTKPQVRHGWRVLCRIWRELQLVRIQPFGTWPGTDDELPEKVMVSHPRQSRLEEAAKALAQLLPGRLEMARSGENYLEVTRAGVSKGVGAARLAEMLGLSRDQVMAIGDQGNDLSMLRWAGLGVAMGHAPEYVKAAADAVTGDNGREEGVARAIERFILEPR